MNLMGGRSTVSFVFGHVFLLAVYEYTRFFMTEDIFSLHFIF